MAVEGAFTIWLVERSQLLLLQLLLLLLLLLLFAAADWEVRWQPASTGPAAGHCWQHHWHHACYVWGVLYDAEGLEVSRGRPVTGQALQL